MKIRGKDIDFKISRLEDAGKFEMALKNMEQTEEKIKEKNSLPEILKGMICMFQTFFKDATGVDVLEGCDDVMEAKTAYYEFLNEVKVQREAILTFTSEDIK